MRTPRGVEPERAEGSGGPFRSEHGRAARRMAGFAAGKRRVTPLGTTNKGKGWACPILFLCPMRWLGESNPKGPCAVFIVSLAYRMPKLAVKLTKKVKK